MKTRTLKAAGTDTGGDVDVRVRGREVVETGPKATMTRTVNASGRVGGPDREFREQSRAEMPFAGAVSASHRAGAGRVDEPLRRLLPECLGHLGSGE